MEFSKNTGHFIRKLNYHNFYLSHIHVQWASAISALREITEIDKAQIPLVASSRHHTTRHLAHAFWHGKSRDVLCRVCRTVRRNTLVATSATRTT